MITRDKCLELLIELDKAAFETDFGLPLFKPERRDQLIEVVQKWLNDNLG